MDKTIYVIGGTNGVGKSTIKDDLIKHGIPYINADFIARGLKHQPGSLMLAELARQYGSEQMKLHIKNDESFAFENNMHEAKSYEWLLTMQKAGYKINLLYVGVQDLEITTKRIDERVKRGEHYVPPGEVLNRYENGIKLLKYYFDKPDTLTLIDNSTRPIIQLEAQEGKITFLNTDAPLWVRSIVDDIKKNTQKDDIKALNSIDQIKELYKKLKR